MKVKHLLGCTLFAFLLFTTRLKAQTNVYSQLVALLKTEYPNLELTEKLIAFNVWSLNDLQSRTKNSEFEKAYKVYEVAKLKGGRRGFIAISINLKDSDKEIQIACNKDGIVNMIPLKSQEIVKWLDLDIKNMVFDSQGNLVYSNLENEKIFEAINNLITR